MKLYQLYWDTGYEGQSGGIILINDLNFTEQEYKKHVKEAINSLGFRTLLWDIVDYLKKFGYETIDTINCNTYDI